jgi:hypothetical protein
VATEAAGEGINLQFCWLMVNFDIPWNPVRLEQRVGRIHRYGQEKDCLVFNFVAQNTREGRVLQTLIERLKEIREDLGSDQVFDVVGEVFPSNLLEKLFREMYLMSEGYDKALTIIVEDSVARTVLTELLRTHDPYFLKSVHIAIGRFEKPRNGVQDSGKEAIRRVMRTLSEAGLKMAAVLDGDDQEDVDNSIYKLPGSRPPEEELVANDSVMQLISDKCNTPVGELRTQLGQFDSCHEYFPYFARIMADDPQYVVRVAAEVYATSADTAAIRRLIELLKEDTA